MYFRSYCFATDITVTSRPYIVSADIVFDIASTKKYKIKNNFSLYRSFSTVFIPSCGTAKFTRAGNEAYVLS